MEYKVVNFEPHHLKRFILRGHTQTALDAIPDLQTRMEWLKYTKSYAYTLAIKPESNRSFTIIACAGIIELWPGVGEAWALVSALVEKYPLCFHRAIKHGLRNIQNAHHFHRIQLTVKVDSPTNYFNWVHILGFQWEGLQRMFGPDRNDHYRYARINP